MTEQMLVTELRWRLRRLLPEPGIVDEIRSVQDLVVWRSRLRNARCSAADLAHLLDLVLAAAAEGRRFRQVDCISTLKRVVKNWPRGEPLPGEITDRLFALYAHYVFSPSEKVQWAVSAMVKDRVLRDEHVRWLIDHEGASEHVVNRLLRYPVPHPVIRAWARGVLRDPKAYPSRRSELLGLVITRSLPKEARGHDAVAVAWAIHYARVPDAVRSRLLTRILSAENLWEIVEIAERHGYAGVIRYAIHLGETGHLDASPPADAILPT